MCVGSKVDISRIEFDGCDAFPCVVHHGTTATGRAYMTANAATDSLTCKVKSFTILWILKLSTLLEDCGHCAPWY